MIDGARNQIREPLVTMIPRDRSERKFASLYLVFEDAPLIRHA